MLSLAAAQNAGQLPAAVDRAHQPLLALALLVELNLSASFISQQPRMQRLLNCIQGTMHNVCPA